MPTFFGGHSTVGILKYSSRAKLAEVRNRNNGTGSEICSLNIKLNLYGILQPSPELELYSTTAGKTYCRPHQIQKETVRILERNENTMSDKI